MTHLGSLRAVALMLSLAALGSGVVGCSGGDDGGSGDEPGALAGGSPNPAWLVGSWSYDGGIENNIPQTSAHKALSLKADGAYTYDTCKSCGQSKGTWKVAGDRLVFADGALGGKSFGLRSAFSSNCRVFDLDGTSLATSGLVAGCPLGGAVATGSACSAVGTYTKSSESGSSSSGSSDSETLVLEADHFFRYSKSHSSWVCYGSTCKTLTSGPADKVGTWSGSAGSLGGVPVDPKGWSFTAGECSGTKGSGSGAGGSTGSGGSSGGGSSSGAGSSAGSDGGTCTNYGGTCDSTLDCCDASAKKSVCVAYGGSTGSRCAARCTANSQCQSGCCAKLDDGTGACSAPSFCGK